MDARIASAILITTGCLSYYAGYKSVKCNNVPVFGVPSVMKTPFVFTIPTQAPVVSQAATRTVVRCPQSDSTKPPVEVEVTGNVTTTVPSPSVSVVGIPVPTALVSSSRYGLDFGLVMAPTLTPSLSSFSFRVAPSARLGDLSFFIGASAEWKFTSPIPSGIGIFVRKEF